MYGRGGSVGGRGGLGSVRGRDVWRKFDSNNNRNKRQELQFYPHGAAPDRQMATFTKVKERLILKIQSEFVNGSDIAESIRKVVILYLIKEITVKMTSTED